MIEIIEITKPLEHDCGVPPNNGEDLSRWLECVNSHPFYPFESILIAHTEALSNWTKQDWVLQARERNGKRRYRVVVRTGVNPDGTDLFRFGWRTAASFVTILNNVSMAAFIAANPDQFNKLFAEPVTQSPPQDQ